MSTLVEFLEGSSVLSWIHVLVLFNRLDTLVMAARTLNWFIDLNTKLNAQKSPPRQIHPSAWCSGMKAHMYWPLRC